MDTLNTLIVAVLGSGGVMGIFFFILRYYIQKQLDKSEKKRQEFREEQIHQDELYDKLQHCYGRMFFWIHKAVVTGQHNGDLENAFQKLQEAEDEKKEFDRQRIAKMNNDN